MVEGHADPRPASEWQLPEFGAPSRLFMIKGGGCDAAPWARRYSTLRGLSCFLQWTAPTVRGMNGYPRSTSWLLPNPLKPPNKRLR
jgi:hypothetical protein